MGDQEKVWKSYCHKNISQKTTLIVLVKIEKLITVTCNFILEDLEFVLNSFSTNVPLKEKPSSWLLLAKCLKNTWGRMIF